MAFYRFGEMTIDEAEIIAKDLGLKNGDPYEQVLVTTNGCRFELEDEHSLYARQGTVPCLALTEIQYHNVLSRVRVNTPRYNSSSVQYLFKLLGKKGFDNIAFMNDRHDSSSIGFIVFDESQLIPVAIDSLSVENSDRTLADSENEPAFLL
ncbi:MAG: hypothetical protein IJZ21_01905 [Clostridia bacterium]|nr:hypothetical protein [Clostridia bacterium]